MVQTAEQPPRPSFGQVVETDHLMGSPPFCRHSRCHSCEACPRESGEQESRSIRRFEIPAFAGMTANVAALRSRMMNSRPILIDSHAHLDAKAFDSDRNQVIQRARDAGVLAVVTVGVGESLGEINKAVALAEEHEGIFATVGVHPHDARGMQVEWYERIKELTLHPKVVGIGETGLDYHYMHSPREVQREAFERFLGLARETGLPAVIHTREADEDTVAILNQARKEGGGEPLCGVVHCFSGGYALAKQVLDLGLHISFTGIVTFPNAGPLREVLRKIPVERVLVETDCPYLSPVPFRGKRNEPARVIHVAETLAQVYGRPIEEVGRITTENTVRLFRLPPGTLEQPEITAS